MKQKNTTLFAVILCCTAALSSNAQNWLLNGNAGTNGNLNFVGTTDNRPLVFRTNNKERMRIIPGGKIGIEKRIAGGGVDVSKANGKYYGDCVAK